MQRPELQGTDGLLSAAQLNATADAIARSQQASGSFPWPDGHTDPWDHVECAIALTAAGRLDEARAGYEWLLRTQAGDGTWAMSYDQDRVLDASVDSNQCAYVAVGVWHWWLATNDRSFVDLMWPTVRLALDFVVTMQLDSGAMAWGRSPQGDVADEALLTGSASTYQALRCGLALAELAAEPQPEWEIAVGRLQHAVAAHPEAFMDKSRYSMDWYYPVLGGAVRGLPAAELLVRRWDDFIIPSFGARCVSDRPWVTGAETAELALSLIATGHNGRAIQLLSDISQLRREDGSYWTGIVVDDGLFWPVEASSWTSAAIVMACDALTGGSTLDLFMGTQLPVGMPVSNAQCQRHEADVTDSWLASRRSAS